MRQKSPGMKKFYERSVALLLSSFFAVGFLLFNTVPDVQAKELARGKVRLAIAGLNPSSNIMPELMIMEKKPGSLVDLPQATERFNRKARYSRTGGISGNRYRRGWQEPFFFFPCEKRKDHACSINP